MHHDSATFTRLARRFARSMGLGTAGILAIAASACGAKVVVDGPSGEGGAGGEGGGTTVAASSSSSSSVGAGGGTYACDVDVAPNQKLVYACLDDAPNGPCPAASEVQDALAAKLNTDDCVDFCCKSTWVSSVPCGPDPSTESGCCYTARMTIGDEVCMGRPFTVEGAARTADVVAREGWGGALDAKDGPALLGLDAEVRRALEEAWARDAAMEHASVASFARFSLSLLSVGAPADLVAGAQEAMGDEIRHARMCFDLASAYAGAPRGPSALAIDGALAGQADPEAIARAAVREGAVGETVAALLAGAAREEAEDPAVREVLARIAADEEAHAELAWRTLAWALAEGDDALIDAVEKEFVDATNALLGPHPTSLDADPAGVMRAHGRLPPATQAAIARRAALEVIAPCAKALVAAARSADRPTLLRASGSDTGSASDPSIAGTRA